MEGWMDEGTYVCMGIYACMYVNIVQVVSFYFPHLHSKLSTVKLLLETPFRWYGLEKYDALFLKQIK